MRISPPSEPGERYGRDRRVPGSRPEGEITVETRAAGAPTGVRKSNLSMRIEKDSDASRHSI